MRLAAVADVFGGGSGLALLAAEPAASIVLQKKAEAARALAEDRDRQLAILIANGVGRVLSGRRGGAAKRRRKRTGG